MENRFSEVPATRRISVPELSRRTRHQLHLARRDDKLSRRFKLEYMEGGAVSSREHSAYSERIACELPQMISHRNLTATVAGTGTGQSLALVGSPSLFLSPEPGAFWGTH